MTGPAESRARKACVMGHRVAYSRSPMIHGHWLRTLGLKGAYELVDIAPEAFPGFFRDLAGRGYVGGNVTTPHKDAAFRLVDRREGPAEAIGAVNTVWYEGARLIGGNTDWVGFLANLDESAPAWDAHGPAVVIGAGGAARAIVYGLLDRGLEVAVLRPTRRWRSGGCCRKLGCSSMRARWARPGSRAWTSISSRCVPRRSCATSITFR